MTAGDVNVHQRGPRQRPPLPRLPPKGWSFYLFVRTDPHAPYAFCGPALYQKHEGNRPIAITWRLEHPLPAALYQRYATLAQG